MCLSLSSSTPTLLGASFDGPQLTSDGGLCWLSEAHTALGFCARLAQHIPEWRAGSVRRSLETLVRQHVTLSRLAHLCRSVATWSRLRVGWPCITKHTVNSLVS